MLVYQLNPTLPKSVYLIDDAPGAQYFDQTDEKSSAQCPCPWAILVRH